MPDRRVEELVDQTERARRELDAQRAERQSRIDAEDAFKKSRMDVYPDEGSLTDSVASEIVQRYLAVVPLIQERCWDFWVAEWISRPNLYARFEIAIRILAYACAGRKGDARDCLIASQTLAGDVKSAHRELYEEFEQAGALTGAPYTPPLTQTEMHKAIGVSYDVFRWAVKTERRVPCPRLCVGMSLDSWQNVVGGNRPASTLRCIGLDEWPPQNVSTLQRAGAGPFADVFLFLSASVSFERPKPTVAGRSDRPSQAKARV
jgi:hypothetical protein